MPRSGTEQRGVNPLLFFWRSLYKLAPQSIRAKRLRTTRTQLDEGQLKAPVLFLF